MVVIVVALDDCTMRVTKAPQNAPDNGVAAALLRVVRSPEPASALRPLVITLMPSRNRPTPPRTEIAVAIRVFSRCCDSQLFTATQLPWDVRPSETLLALPTKQGAATAAGPALCLAGQCRAHR